MKKNLRTSIDGLLKLALLIFLISFVGLIECAKTSYATSSKTLGSTAMLSKATPKPKPKATPKPKPTATPKATPKPTATATPKPTATATPKPTATATPKPTATATQLPQATSTPLPQVSSMPTSRVLPNSPVMTIPPTTVPTATSVVSTTPTAIVTTPGIAKSIPLIPVIHYSRNKANQGSNTVMIVLILGMGAPLFLILGGGALWLLTKWRTNRSMPQEGVQANPGANSSEMQSSLQTLPPPSDLMPMAQVTGASGVSPMPTPYVQPTYTPSKLSLMTTTFPPQMLVMNSSEGGCIGSLDLSLNTARAIEANGNGQMPLELALPIELANAPTSLIPSSPLKSSDVSESVKTT